MSANYFFTLGGLCTPVQFPEESSDDDSSGVESLVLSELSAEPPAELLPDEVSCPPLEVLSSGVGSPELSGKLLDESSDEPLSDEIPDELSVVSSEELSEEALS